MFRGSYWCVRNAFFPFLFVEQGFDKENANQRVVFPN